MTAPPACSVVIAEPDRQRRSRLATVVRGAVPEVRLRFALEGSAVLRLAATEPPDAVILHPALPRTDLAGLCSRLRATYTDVAIFVVGPGVPDERRLGELGVSIVPQGVRSSEVMTTELTRLLRQRSAPRRRSAAATEPMTLSGPWRARPAASSSPPPPPSLGPPVPQGVALGEIIGKRYLVEQRLGSGGMGSVFAVRHLDLDKRFALKLLMADHASSATARASFITEAKLACRLVHPNIVSVIDFGNDPRRGMYMVMELLAGATMSAAAPRLSVRRACELLGQTADALDMLHRHDVVHGDVKTDNIMVIEEPDGPRRRSVARLIDFGLAHRISHLLGEGVLSGTPEYLAPERVSGGSPSVAADVYGLGVIAFEVIAGTLPFHGSIEEVLQAQLSRSPPPLRLRDGKPADPALVALVARALDKDPARRHPTAAAFRYELNTVMDMLGYGRHQKTVDDSRFTLVFQHSLLPQAVLREDGQVQLANEAFRALVARFDDLVTGDPGVLAAIAAAREERRAIPYLHTSAEAPPLELLFAPTDKGVHVVARALEKLRGA